MRWHRHYSSFPPLLSTCCLLIVVSHIVGSKYFQRYGTGTLAVAKLAETGQDRGEDEKLPATRCDIKIMNCRRGVPYEDCKPQPQH